MTRQRVQQMIAAHELPAIKIGSTWAIREAHVAQVAAKSTTTARAKAVKKTESARRGTVASVRPRHGRRRPPQPRGSASCREVSLTWKSWRPGRHPRSHNREARPLHTNDVSVPAVQYTWTAQRGDVSRFSRLALWRFLRRPRIVLFFAVMVVAMAVALWGGEAELTGFFAGIVIALPLAVFVVVLRAQRTMVGPGARWASGINSFGMLLEDPVAQIVIGHGSIAKIEVDHGLVYLYVRGGMGRAACIPEALCPPEVRAYLLSMTAAPSRSAREANSAHE